MSYGRESGYYWAKLKGSHKWIVTQYTQEEEFFLAGIETRFFADDFSIIGDKIFNPDTRQNCEESKTQIEGEGVGVRSAATIKSGNLNAASSEQPPLISGENDLITPLNNSGNKKQYCGNQKCIGCIDGFCTDLRGVHSCASYKLPEWTNVKKRSII